LITIAAIPLGSRGTSGIEQVLKPTDAQAFFPQATVKLSTCVFCVGFPG